MRERGYGAWSVPCLPYVLRSSKLYIVRLEGCDNLSMVQVWVRDIEWRCLHSQNDLIESILAGSVRYYVSDFVKVSR